LKLVAAGLSNRQTAVEMNVSIKTVQKHRQSVMNKVNLHDTASLTRYAITRGILLDNQFRRDLSHQWHVNPVITVRENQVLMLIADGLANKQIASELNISIKTVENHRQGLMNRLNIHEVAGLTRYAICQVPVRIHVSAAVAQGQVPSLSPAL
jgi:DNA-binding NarL/FixJ family response regulator